jgi:hypothetical protein
MIPHGRRPSTQKRLKVLTDPTDITSMTGMELPSRIYIGGDEMKKALLIVGVIGLVVVAHLIGVPTFAGIVADIRIIRKFFPVCKVLSGNDLGKR